MIAGVFEVVAKPMEWMYELTHSYIAAIALMALIVMVITAPLVLKSTKGMLEMQRLAPEMRRLQNEYRSDRQKLNEEMMKLYQEHKVNPLASCFPLLLQMPVFIIMFQVLNGLTKRVGGEDGPFTPRFVADSSEIFQSLVGQTEMISFGLDLSRSPLYMMQESFGKGVLYALLVVALGLLYFAQQKMTAARATVSPTMSAGQQKLMLYLPVVFAVFQVFFLTGLVIYYMCQAVFRIGLQYYITHRFYRGDNSLGRQAQAASEKARELAKDNGGGGMFAQAKRDMATARDGKNAPAKGTSGRPQSTNRRVTPAKGQAAAGVRAARPQSSGRAARPAAGRSTSVPDTQGKGKSQGKGTSQGKGKK
jgi:YidC/Oxa1 family membrane protein insertase